MNRKEKKLRRWLLKKKATPTDIKIYEIASSVSKIRNNDEFHHADIALFYPTSRTNITQYLRRMVQKGIIKWYPKGESTYDTTGHYAIAKPKFKE